MYRLFRRVCVFICKSYMARVINKWIKTRSLTSSGYVLKVSVKFVLDEKFFIKMFYFFNFFLMIFKVGCWYFYIWLYFLTAIFNHQFYTIFNYFPYFCQFFPFFIEIL